MQTHWIKNNRPTLLLFFTGWAMDERPTLHMNSGVMDVCTCFDYRDPRATPGLMEAWNTYEEVLLIAWSLGIWVASTMTGLRYSRSVAINGTLWPIHPQKGIPPEVFQATLEHLSEASTTRFFRRMSGTALEYARFQQRATGRPFPEQQEELHQLATFFEEEQKCMTHAASARHKPHFAPANIWDTALIGTRDLIFPPENMLQAWKGHSRIIVQDLPHDPFGSFSDWNQILEL